MCDHMSGENVCLLCSNSVLARSLGKSSPTSLSTYVYVQLPGVGLSFNYHILAMEMVSERPFS